MAKEKLMTTYPNSKDEFKNLISEIESQSGYQRPQAFGIGLATVNRSGNTLEVLFPCPNFEANYGSAAVLAKVCGHTAGTASYSLTSEMLEDALKFFAPFEGENGHKNIDTLNQFYHALNAGIAENKKVLVTFIEEGSGPSSVEDAYLRLQCISHRLVKPHGISLAGIFGKLPNVAWTDEGCIDLTELEERQFQRRCKGEILLVHSVDKFPRMTDYVVPSGIRLCDAIRVRLGAYIGEGTTFMHEGFCNFNAGTEGPNMIEGRISAGVFVKANSDLGGGCSTMGTLSGGGEEVITVGAGCLLGANSGTGIALGDNCTLEAGLYLTAGTKVKLTETGEFVKARELSGCSDRLFRRNSQTGIVEATLSSNAISLNEELHTNQ